MPITKQSAKKILRETGAKRVSDSAAMEFADILNKYAYSIANKAAKLASHAKRTTVKKEDVELAS
ncbi:MAG: NFYB/HAP3 family transcription factor subunit [Candidatus Marsarchaeota archaeon]|nr:NFYB/HAP3 family transcription factor subunit [Candidatus Marsarchaeota archaeon]MCL5413104.1 NFYB/HAP3 family transcription factor subunit [Candidatus Marsarchaeota archaeon]